MSRKQLSIGFPSKDISYDDLKTYLFGLLTEEFTLRRGKNKGRKKPTNVKINLSSDQDYNLLVNYKHLINGVPITVQPFLTREERQAQIKDKLARRLYVSNLPLSAVHQDLFDIFSVFGELDEIFLKRKTHKTTRNPFYIAFVTFKTKQAAKACEEQREVFFRRSDYVLELLKCTSTKGESSSDENGNMVVVSPRPHQLAQASVQIQPSMMGFESVRGYGLEQANSVAKQLCHQHSQSTEKHEEEFPFRRICQKSDQTDDWMGQKITEKFDISRVARSQNILTDHEEPTELGRNLGFAEASARLGGCSNIRFNYQDRTRNIRSHRGGVRAPSRKF